MKLKKYLSIILALLMALACIPFAFAEDAKPAQPDGSELKIEVNLDKEQYNLFDTVTAEIKITNVSEKALGNIYVNVLSLDSYPLGYLHNNSFMASGDSDSLTCDFQLSSKASGLNFFARLLLFIRELFTGRYFLVNRSMDLDYFPVYEKYPVDFGINGIHNIEIAVSYDIFESDSENVSEIVEAYNNAAAATDRINGRLSMNLVEGSLKMDGPGGKLLPTLEGAVASTLGKNTAEIRGIPGDPPLAADDVVGAYMKSKGNKTRIVLILKDQVDGLDADPQNGGPVSRGIGTLGSISSALDDLGAEIVSGKDTASITYTNAVILVDVDNTTGKIVFGSWKFRATIRVTDAVMQMGNSSVDFKNMEAAIDYRIIH